LKKVVIEKSGSYDQLKIVQFPDPIPGKGQILIETKACGVNFADCLIRMGVYQSVKEFVGLPCTPGFEVSGIVKSVGEGVSHFQPGQNVVALTLFDGYSSHVVVPEAQAFAMPESLDFAQAAAMPTAYVTAYYALFELAHPRKEQFVLVHSAAGGVGSALIQLAKLAGCQVVGVVGASHKVESVKMLGADLVIDKSTQDLWKEVERFAPKGYDIILDANGVETLRESYNHLASCGRLVVYGFHSMLTKGRGKPNWFKLIWDYVRTPRFNPLTMTNDNKSVLAFNLSYLIEKTLLLRSDMYQLLTWHAMGKISPLQIKTYPFEQVALAHRDLESGQTIGKLVLLP
jgi:NADPH:quinone reductase-like Zn-dependent oxidoreductase